MLDEMSDTRSIKEMVRVTTDDLALWYTPRECLDSSVAMHPKSLQSLMITVGDLQVSGFRKSMSLWNLGNGGGEVFEENWGGGVTFEFSKKFSIFYSKNPPLGIAFEGDFSESWGNSPSSASSDEPLCPFTSTGKAIRSFLLPTKHQKSWNLLRIGMVGQVKRVDILLPIHVLVYMEHV